MHQLNHFKYSFFGFWGFNYPESVCGVDGSHLPIADVQVRDRNVNTAGSEIKRVLASSVETFFMQIDLYDKLLFCT